MFGQREVPTLTTGLEGGSGNNVVALTIYQKKYEHPEEPEEWSRARGCLMDLMEMLMRNTRRLVTGSCQNAKLRASTAPPDPDPAPPPTKHPVSFGET